MNPILTGIAGEYFVAGELSRRGCIASITLRNTDSIDILVSKENKNINIQVKTRCIETTDGWKMGEKELKEDYKYEKTYYVFVEISSDPNSKIIKYFIIPKNKLNKAVEKNFREWKQRKNQRTGEPRKANLRVFRIREYPELNTEKYEDNWNQLFNC